MTKQIDNQGHQQLQDSAMQRQSPWQIIYNGYKSNSAILKDKYSPLLREEIISKQSKDPHALADIFKNIAEDNIGLARADDTNQSLKLYYYNDGAIACHHGLSVIEKANCNNDLGLQRLQELERKICGSLNDIQTEMVEMCRGKVELLQSISRKADLSNISKYGLLEQLRAETKKQLDDIEAAKEAKDDSAYIDLTAKAFKQVANGMGKYLEALYGEAERMLGPPPCDYTVIGLGSMALRQMTPYSDLEFAILTGNENYKQSADFTVREYFRNLTQLVHFKVINLGETIMPLSSYGFDFKDFIKTAVNFDLGGKTPLGRIDKPYELIQTVDGMINYLKNDGDKTSHIDKTLLFILQKSCPIYQHGDKDLAKEYQSQANEFLLSLDKTNGRPYCENRAVQVLAKGGVEIDYTKQTPQEHKSVGNLKQFSFNFDDTVGRLFDVKQEIYRMPDRFIYNLGMIHGIQEESSWDTIDKLCDKGIINSEGAANLKKALSFATNLRLKTYSHYGYQKDTMDFAKTYETQSDLQSKAVEREVEQELTKVFKLSPEDLQEDGALFQYYYTALALRKKLKEFCKLDNDRKAGFFNKNKFYRDDAKTKAQINSRLLRYEDALKWELKELQIRKETLGDDHLNVATILNNIGMSYKNLGDHSKALQYVLEGFKVLKQSLNDTHPMVGMALQNIGGLYGDLGDYNTALRNVMEGFKILQQSLSSDHPILVNGLHHIGGLYGALGDPQRALNYQEQALAIRKKSLGEDHPDVATSLDNIGYHYGILGNYKKALNYQEQALAIRKKSLGEDHPNVAISLEGLGLHYSALEDHQRALEYYTQALIIRTKTLREHHLGIVNSLDCISYTYVKLGDYNTALKYQEKALEIRRKSLGEDHPNVVTNLDNIGFYYSALEDHQRALGYYTQALIIRTSTLRKNPLDIANSLDCVSCTYAKLGDYNTALIWQKKILEIRKKSLGDDHLEVATTLNIIGCICRALGNHQEALKCHERALEIVSKRNESNQEDIIKYKYLLVDTYCNLKLYNKALEQLNSILDMYKKSEQTDKISECKQKIDNIVSILETNSTFTDIPEKSEEGVRVISYNITADFFDNKDTTADQHHHWKYRAPFVKVLLKKLYPDIMCLQELSAEQALELHQYFNREGGYKSIFLSQTPSEVETGAIACGEQVQGWGNKFLGASLIGTFINKSFEFVETGRFWLNENPNLVPTAQDRGEIDKGFGNMNTYRAVLWAKVKMEGNKSLYIFNSHYPLSGNNETRFKCAELEMDKIREIAKGSAWVSVGDKNIIPTKDDNEQYNPQVVYNELTKHGKNIIQGGDNHYGPSTTWIGYTYDPYQNPINDDTGEFIDSSKLDVIVSNLDATCSFHHPGAFEPNEFRIIPIADALTEEHNKQRYFASDHALIGADFVIDNNH